MVFILLQQHLHLMIKFVDYMAWRLVQLI